LKIRSTKNIPSADVIPALWFSYAYTHGPKEKAVTQRIKFANLAHKPERLAHITNHIFSQGFVESKWRPVVHWQAVCGKRVEEHTKIEELLWRGEGDNEDKPLRLVIGMFILTTLLFLLPQS
jgi:hypothetical protein